MKQLTPYLIFLGNCKEAMTFYSECLQGEITVMQSYKDSPVKVNDENKERIFNSHMIADDLLIRASDNLVENKTIIGTNFSLFISFSNLNELEQVFDKLSQDGTIFMKLSTSPGGKFGMLKDKFGIQWMLSGPN